MNESPQVPAHKAPLLFLLLTAFLFAMGISLVFPVLPFIVAQSVPQVSQQATVIGLLGAAYAFLSFFSAPVLGALSDAYGRRPILILSLLGSAIGYVLFGVGGSLWMLFVGRSIEGLFAGGFGALFGYVADTTPAGERGRVFGLLGATTGAAFILGPAIGGLASHLSLSAPMFLAAGVSLLNMLWGLFVLPESLPASRRVAHFDAAHLNPLGQLSGALAVPAVRRLVTVSVLFLLPLSILQVTLALLGRDTLGWGPSEVSTLFIIIGATDIVAQGVLLPWLIRALKERGVAVLGLLLGVIGMGCMALLPVFPHAALLYVGTLLFAVGEGMFTAAQNTLISIAAPAEAQGQVQGGAQAFSSLAQVVGPLGGGQLYSRLGPGAEYGTVTALVMAALGLLLGQRPPMTSRVEPCEQQVV
ncbi:MFS transporter [Deinococcus radiopugnans]|uniref:DHA1 family tetracycline resistance protein-like MFS transporter n=1 Tax=Deinococcus radiopugnans ATCC 19172 TaxID=585398 RepID=A0A5C4XVP6_9DEIO|nr:MFS transporter [Deinococcus radiopugnans]MBB6018593.1 DHA1 family tetracycline resistance protein-like MFS transporter [Deinococcus radiopugnans ATCC 19172]TNM67292.1 TCR/Tet family MFS transporter [Deinococcus radiopugnans ATCC 19172]